MPNPQFLRMMKFLEVKEITKISQLSKNLNKKYLKCSHTLFEYNKSFYVEYIRRQIDGVVMKQIIIPTFIKQMFFIEKTKIIEFDNQNLNFEINNNSIDFQKEFIMCTTNF